MVSDGVPPNTKTFTALIGTFAKCGPLESALDTIQNVIQQDGSGSAIGTYAALMSACEKAGQWDLAIALFDRMTALVRFGSLVLTGIRAISMMTYHVNARADKLEYITTTHSPEYLCASVLS